MRSLRTISTAAAALALALTGTLAGTLASTATGSVPGTGQVVVNIVDHLGAPTSGGAYLIGASGLGGIGEQQTGTTVTFDDVPVGSYGVFTVTPWGGFTCVGLSTCDYFALQTGTAVPDGSLVVTDQGTTTRTLGSDAPATVAGSGRVGSPLSLKFSEGLQQLYALLGGVGGGLVISPSVQWLRDGAPIAGAIDDTYTPVGADVGKQVSAKLTYAGLAASYMQQLSGAVPPSITTSKVAVTKIPAKAFIRLVRTTITDEQHAVVRFDATSKGLVVFGKATVWVGKQSQTRVLRNGSMVVRTPELAPGKYVISATFQGSDVFESATAKKKTLTVVAK